MKAAVRVPGFRAILAWLLLLACVGCASSEYITMRRVPHNPLAGPLRLLSRSGPKATQRTSQLLRRYALADEDPEVALAGLEAEIAEEPIPEKLFAFAELAYVRGKKSEALGKRGEALELYGAAVTHAYWYLFDPELDRFRNPYDPQFRGACDLYNGALEAALRILNEKDPLRPGGVYRISTGRQEFNLEVVSRGRWHDHDFERLEFVSDYEIKGLTNRHHTYGLGVPLIAVRRLHEGEEPAEQYYPKGLSFATTAFLRVSAPPRGAPEGARHCVLELHDPLNGTDIQVADRRVPLETDLTTPLAYFLDNPKFRRRTDIATLALLSPDSARSLEGMYMVEPYDPDKIPVVMVHGLWSSPITWMEMFNDLRSFPEIRRNYQFWFYLYPTGQPFWISGARMREDLAELRATLDPAYRTPALDQMVLVGHSMGGLVSKLQAVDSGDDFWRLLSDRSFEELKADEEARERLAQVVFFDPNPSVRRVITIGTPHRGSEFANSYTRWLGRQLIWLPEMVVRATNSLTRENSGFFRDTELLTISTSIDSLAPDSPVLPALLAARRSPYTTYHNIVGVVPNEGLVGRLAGGGDGIVDFASAHLDDVASEIAVPADHLKVHQHPLAILEVRRILLEHRREAVAEMRERGAALPASYPGPADVIPIRP